MAAAVWRSHWKTHTRFLIIQPNVNTDFHNFYRQISTKIYHKVIKVVPPYLKLVATLFCEFWQLRITTEFTLLPSCLFLLTRSKFYPFSKKKIHRQLYTKTFYESINIDRKLLDRSVSLLFSPILQSLLNWWDFGIETDKKFMDYETVLWTCRINDTIRKDRLKSNMLKAEM